MECLAWVSDDRSSRQRREHWLVMNFLFPSRLLLAALLLCSGALCTSGNAQDENEPPALDFASQFGGDPFASDEPQVKLSATFELIEGTLEGRINVTAEVREDQHIYSVNQQPRGPTKSTITVVAGQGVELTGPFQPDTPPTIKFFQDIYPDLPIEEHEGTVTWSAPIQLEEGIDTASLVISVEERVPIALVSTEQGLLGFDRDATSFELPNVPFDLPIVTGLGSVLSDSTLSEYAVRRHVARFIETAQSRHPLFWSRVSEVCLVTAEEGDLILADGMTLKVRLDGVSDQIKNYRAFMASGYVLPEDLAYVDLRYRNQVVAGRQPADRTHIGSVPSLSGISD